MHAMGKKRHAGRLNVDHPDQDGQCAACMIFQEHVTPETIVEDTPGDIAAAKCNGVQGHSRKQLCVDAMKGMVKVGKAYLDNTGFSSSDMTPQDVVNAQRAVLQYVRGNDQARSMAESWYSPNLHAPAGGSCAELNGAGGVTIKQCGGPLQMCQSAGMCTGKVLVAA